MCVQAIPPLSSQKRVFHLQRFTVRRVVQVTREKAAGMSENVTSALIFETLKAMQAKLGDMAGDLHDLKTDVRGIKGHMAAFMQSELARALRAGRDPDPA
jgi:hypothetical protein